MKRECERVEEAIWEHARTGRELSEDVRHHLEACPECQSALAEAIQISQPLHGAYAVPSAPNCRPAVMASISRRARRAPAVWAYACAAVLVVVLAITGITVLAPRSEGPEKQVVRTVDAGSPKPEQSVKVTEDLPKQDDVDLEVPAPVQSGKQAPVAEDTVAQRDPVAPKNSIRHRKTTPPKERPKPVREEQPPEPEEPVEPPEPAPVEEYEDYDRPVALVMVSFPTGHREETESYGYTQRNTETGEVTKCSVTRSGDSIEIYLESTPGGDQPPVKGSVDYENNASA